MFSRLRSGLPDVQQEARSPRNCAGNSTITSLRFARFIGSIIGESGENGRSWSSKKSPGRWRFFIRRCVPPTIAKNLSPLANWYGQWSDSSPLLPLSRALDGLPARGGIRRPDRVARAERASHSTARSYPDDALSLAGMYRPLFLSAIALSAVVLFQQRYRRRLGWLAALVLFVYSYNAASCLEVAIINSLEVRRYVTVQVFFTIFAQFLALWLLCEMALERRIRGSFRGSACDAKVRPQSSRGPRDWLGCCTFDEASFAEARSTPTDAA